MALFDTLISEVAEKFHLGNKAAPLLSGLFSLMTSEQSGGLAGFLNRFKQAGLGDQVTSWVNRGDKQPLTTTQLEDAVGGNVLDQLASKAGVVTSSAAPALAYVIPKAVGLMTPGGVIPTGLPAGGAVRETVGAGARRAAETKGGGLGFLKWLLPLVAIPVLAFFGYRACSTEPTSSINASRPANATIPAVSTPSINPRLTLSNVDGKVKVAGLVPDEKTKQTILDQLKATYGDGNYLADISVDAKAKPIGWLSKLGDALAVLKGTPGAEMNFDGEALKVGGLSGAALTGLVDKFKSIFGSNFNVSAVGNVDVKATVAEAAKNASEALANLKPGFTAQDLVGALNLTIINFASGSADIPQDGVDLLTKSAATIKQSPQGTVLEVGGHTDDQGNAAGNQALSQRRAEAVRAFLTKQGVNSAALIAKGYGSENPVSTNDTEEGRFKNRRIAFTVVK